MKYIFLVLPIFFSCSVMALQSESIPGQKVFDILLGISNVKLKSEPLCDFASPNVEQSGLSLKNHLAKILSVSYESENFTKLTSSCESSKVEVTPGALIDIWDCKLEVETRNKEGEFISSSIIAFSINKQVSEYMVGSLRCF